MSDYGWNEYKQSMGGLMGDAEHTADRTIDKLKARIAELEAEVERLRETCNELEHDREYNAGLVEQRDAENARLREVVDRLPATEQAAKGDPGIAGESEETWVKC